MDHPGFFENSGPFSISEIAKLVNAEIVGEAADKISIQDVKPLDLAGSGHIGFFENKKYLSQFEATKASACIVSNSLKNPKSTADCLLIVNDAYRAYAVILDKFYPDASKPVLYGAATGEPESFIHPTAMIEAGAVIGRRTYIGRNCHVGANTSVCCSIIGDNVIVHQGASIGQDGFGFAMGAQGHLKVPQIGRVIIQDHVEIGANTTIDRGALKDTIIGEGTKIDNLVQIGHNVVVGRNCIIVSQVGISGSTELGDFVVFGGQGGCVGHIKIGDGVKIAANGKITNNVEPGSVIGGAPAVPIMQWKRELVAIKRLAAKKR